MISLQFNFIYIHVPKVAGQSIEKYFTQAEFGDLKPSYDQLLRYNPDPKKGPVRLAHLTLSEYLSLGYCDPKFFDQCFKFGFVRCPWERLVSVYNFRLPVNTRYTFLEWLEQVLTDLNPSAHEYSAESRHLMPQINYFTIDGKLCSDIFVGRFETLSKEFMHIQRKLGLPEETLPHINVSAHKEFKKKKLKFLLKKPKFYSRDISDYYKNNPFISLVKEVYKQDFEEFGYDANRF